jgi:hypothetical protein
VIIYGRSSDSKVAPLGRSLEMIRAILILSVVLVFANQVYANGIESCLSDWGASCYGMQVSICPQGDFEFIHDGCGSGNDYIWVHVVDKSGYGIAGIPCTDYWLQACDPAEELCLCANPVVADSITNGEGRTTISGRIAAGGCVVSGGLYLAVQGQILVTWPACVAVTCHSIVIASVDLIVDCRVNLSDLAVFGFSYNKNLGDWDYNPCCDYNDDDKCNLSDFAYMGAHYLHECY